jgi:hypothetical protein
MSFTNELKTNICIYWMYVEIRNKFKNQCDIFLILYYSIFINELCIFKPTIILSVKGSWNINVNIHAINFDYLLNLWFGFNWLLMIIVLIISTFIGPFL